MIWILVNPLPLLLIDRILGVGLVRIRQINSPYHTTIGKSITSIIVDTIIPLAVKVHLATQIFRVKGGPTCTRARMHMRATFQVLRL